MKPVCLKFMVEKREGFGEDSEPLSIIKDNSYAVGVFDGMGGSGAATCKSEFGDNHTKAYVASRIILTALEDYISKNDAQYISAQSIKQRIKEKLEKEKSKYPAKGTSLRSRMVRDYPTTLAITTAYENDDGTKTVTSYWAGDSRNYLWTTEGFYQISKDDLDVELDPMENLRNDGALSNCVCADRDFQINCNCIKNVEGKFIILSATDGCFNYFATPMHFQNALLMGLQKAENEKEWEKFNKEEINKVTGDDFSLSLLAIGFEKFDDLKETFKQSNIPAIPPISSIQTEIEKLRKEINEKEDELETCKQEGWNSYKKSYMKYVGNGEDDSHPKALKDDNQQESSDLKTQGGLKNSVNMEETTQSETADLKNIEPECTPISHEQNEETTQHDVKGKDYEAINKTKQIASIEEPDIDEGQGSATADSRSSCHNTSGNTINSGCSEEKDNMPQGKTIM